MTLLYDIKFRMIIGLAASSMTWSLQAAWLSVCEQPGAEIVQSSAYQSSMFDPNNNQRMLLVTNQRIDNCLSITLPVDANDVIWGQVIADQLAANL